MNRAMSRLFAILGALFALVPSCTLFAAPSDGFPETVAALQARYADELIAHGKYGAYAAHAEDEGYPAIAHLFKAIAASEAVHADNFARLLREMGHQPLMPSFQVELTSTREHLQQAATVEADEIDTEYPAILARIRPEQHGEAMRFITYAWEAEKQHRELILKIKEGASWFFGLLVTRIEGNPTRYYVCQVCGSTVKARPERQCPICDHAVDAYREVPPSVPTGDERGGQ